MCFNLLGVKKMKQNRTRNRITATMVGLAGLLVGAGCSEFHPAFRPNQISSTHKQRGLFDFGKKIEMLYEGGEKWTIDDSADTLYVRADAFSEALEQFKVENNGSYNELFEGARLQIAFDDPKSGKEIVETQIVANDGTIDSKYLGSFNAFTTRTKLDEAITKRAREKFNDSTIEVAVQHITYPMAERSEVFLGFGAVNSSNGPLSIIPLATQPMTAQFAAMAGPTYDTKYIAHIKPITNAPSVSAEDPIFISRVIAYGPTGNFVSGMYADLNFGHKDYVLGLGNRPLDNFNATVGTAGDTIEGILRVTGGYVIGRGNVDLIMNENVYLPSKTAEGKNNVEDFTDRVNQAKGAVDAVKGLENSVKGE